MRRMRNMQDMQHGRTVCEVDRSQGYMHCLPTQPRLDTVTAATPLAYTCMPLLEIVNRH